LENSCRLISLVQKAKRVSERAKKRVATEQARKNEVGGGESGD
jgi:hypothetical protein